MIYLLDTDILSNLLRRAPPAALVAQIARIPLAERCTSSITVGELFYGAQRLGEQATSLLQRIEELLVPSLMALPFDTAAARRYGTLRADLERRGVPIGDADVRIAAIGLTHRLTVVTGNVRHFGRVPGLIVENWLM